MKAEKLYKGPNIIEENVGLESSRLKDIFMECVPEFAKYLSRAEPGELFEHMFKPARCTIVTTPRCDTSKKLCY